MSEENEKKIQIIVKGNVENDRILLLKIIQECLERDHYFRTYFEGYQIQTGHFSEFIKREEKSEDGKV